MTNRAKNKTLAKDAYLKGIPGTLQRQVKGGKLKPVGIPEECIQNAVEDYLEIKGIKFLHIPDVVYRMCAHTSRTPIWDKKKISQYLSGVPDIIAFKKVTDNIDNDCLLLELKRLNGKPRQKQKNWGAGLNVHYPDSVDSAIKIINEWMANES